jgi:hypothetical protein
MRLESELELDNEGGLMEGVTIKIVRSWCRYVICWLLDMPDLERERKDLEAVVISEACMWLADPKLLLDSVFLPHYTSNTSNMSSILSHAPSTIPTFPTCISPYVTEYRYPSSPDMAWLKPDFAAVRHCLVPQGSILA